MEEELAGGGIGGSVGGVVGEEGGGRRRRCVGRRECGRSIISTPPRCMCVCYIILNVQ